MSLLCSNSKVALLALLEDFKCLKRLLTIELSYVGCYEKHVGGTR